MSIKFDPSAIEVIQFVKNARGSVAVNISSRDVARLDGFPIPVHYHTSSLSEESLNKIEGIVSDAVEACLRTLSESKTWDILRITAATGDGKSVEGFQCVGRNS